MTNSILFISTFLASLVESVEALTIVLAIGITRGWRSTWIGVAAALAILSITVVILGPTLLLMPLNIIRLIIGSLLLLFGLQWIKKSILRSSGHKPKHDEFTAYLKQTKQSMQNGNKHTKGLITDWYAFTIAFKGVLLEGLEIVFIVLTFGVNQGDITSAIKGAGLAIIIIVMLGILIHKPLVKVPENILKQIVGIMLTSFGIFWCSEGAGISWPGNDLAIIWIIATISLAVLVIIKWLKVTHVSKTVSVEENKV